MQGLYCKPVTRGWAQQACGVPLPKHYQLLAIVHSSSPAREADYELARQAVLQQWQTHRKRGKRSTRLQDEQTFTATTADKADERQTKRADMMYASQTTPRKASKSQQKQAARAVRMSVKIARHRRSVWSLVRRLQAESHANKTSTSPKAVDSDSPHSSTAGVVGSALSQDLVLLLKLSQFRPQGLQDTRVQVVQVANEARVWHRVTKALQNKEALQSLSLQQLCFLTAALAALQHPCQITVFEQLCQTILPKLVASIRSLMSELENTQSNFNRMSPVVNNSSPPPIVYPKGQSVIQYASFEAAKYQQSITNSTHADATENVQQTGSALGISLGLYPAASLAVGLLRIQIAQQQHGQPGETTRRSVIRSGQQDDGIRLQDSTGSSLQQTSIEFLASAALPAKDSNDNIQHDSSSREADASNYRLVVHQIIKLLGRWLQVALKLHKCTPNKSRHNASWFVRMVWCLTVVPARYSMPSHDVHSTRTAMPMLQALHADLAHTVTSHVLAKKGQLTRLLDADAALQLAVTLASTRTHIHGPPGSNSQRSHSLVQVHATSTIAGSNGMRNAVEERQQLSGLQAHSASGIRSQSSSEATLMVEPSKQLAIKLLIKQAHAQCGMLTPEGLAQMMAHLAAAPSAVVIEAYTSTVSGTSARGSVSLMQRLSKLLRARMHVIKLRELVTIISCFACLMKRAPQLGSSVQILPDHLVLDELARWAANKLTNASPGQAAQLVSSLASLRWYNKFWWGKAGHYLMRVSIHQNGFGMQEIQQVLTSFAIVGHTPRTLVSHITLLLLAKMQAVHTSDSNDAARSQTQEISAASAASILATYVQLNCFNKDLYHHLGALAANSHNQDLRHMLNKTRADGDDGTYTQVQPDVVCYLAAGCASLGYLPSSLANAALEAVVQLQNLAVNKRNSGATRRCIVGLAHVTYAAYVSGHSESEPLAAALLDAASAASDNDLAAAMASSKAVGAALLICALQVLKESGIDNRADKLHKKLQQTPVARMRLYSAAVQQYWDSTSLLGRYNPSQAASVNRAAIGKQMCETLSAYNATNIMHRQVPADVDLLRISTQNTTGLIIRSLMPDVCCHMRLLRRLDGASSMTDINAAASAASDHVVCFFMHQKPYFVGSIESGMYRAEYDDTVLKTETMSGRIADRTVVTVLFDVNSWSREDSLDAHIACIKEAVWNAGWQT